MTQYRFDNNTLGHFVKFGGYSLGMEMASSRGSECGFSLPRQQTVEVDMHYDLEVVQRLVQAFPNGFGVKKSGINESFSENSVRGVNSSRGYFWSPEQNGSAAKVLQNAIHEAQALRGVDRPKALVVQEYVRGWRLAVNALSEKVICEAADENNRFYIESCMDGAVHTEAFGRAEGAHEQEATIMDMIPRISKLHHMLGFDTNLEFIVADAPYITQLRPIPNEDCLHYVDATKGLESTTAIKELHSTHCVNGIWDSSKTYKIDEYQDGLPYVVFKKSQDIRKCNNILDSLASAKPTLVLDPYQGFSITHEPENLPADLKLRRYFGCISIANSDIGLEPGQEIKIDINKYRGVIYE